MRHRGVWLALLAPFVAETTVAQDQPAAPPPVLRLASSLGKPIALKLRFESSTDTSTNANKPTGPTLTNYESSYEMTLSLDVLAADATGALAVKLRIARIAGHSARMGLGSFDFDSETGPSKDPVTRLDECRFMALAGTEFGLSVGPDASVSDVNGIEEARTLAGRRMGADALISTLIDSWISEESVRALFLSLVGPAPLPSSALTRTTKWTDKDTLEFNSWETTYEISRTLQPSAIAKDSVKLGGKGTVKLAKSRDPGLLPLLRCKTLKSSEVSDWTLSATDGLPISGSETITMDGTLISGKDSVSAKHKATFRVTRTTAPAVPTPKDR